MHHETRTRHRLLPLLLAGLLPLAAQAAGPAKGSVQREISEEMAEARREVRQELAAARAELETENLDVGNSLHFGKSGHSADRETLPKAEITPRGDFLIDGKEVAIDAAQREQLLAYRRQVIGIGRQCHAATIADQYGGNIHNLPRLIRGLDFSGARRR